MSTTLQQLNALTTIRKQVEQHFPRAFFYTMEQELMEGIPVGNLHYIEWDTTQECYVLKDYLHCVVCSSTYERGLIEVATPSGGFHLCTKCRDEIAHAPTLVRG